MKLKRGRNEKYYVKEIKLDEKYYEQEEQDEE